MEWQPTPVFLPGKFHGQRSLVGCSPQGHKESDTTEHTHTRARAHTHTHTHTHTIKQITNQQGRIAQELYSIFWNNV